METYELPNSCTNTAAASKVVICEPLLLRFLADKVCPQRKNSNAIL